MTRPLFRPRLLVYAFFGTLLLLGGWLYRDYGVSWDEPTDRLNGQVSARYVAEHLAPGWLARHPRLAQAPPLENFLENDHGVLFELPLVFLDHLLFAQDNPPAYYRMRHVAVFLVSVAGVWGLYRLGRLRFGHWGWGLLAALLLVLSPRFFAESFYNAKDLVFTALFTLAMLTLARWQQCPTTGRLLLHALATAAAVDVRVLGILVVAFTLGLAGLSAWPRLGADRQAWRPVAGRLGFYLAATMLFITLGWPYLWADPFERLWNAYRSMSHFRWEEYVRYLGAEVLATRLPWHYAPVWMLVTIPVPYVLAFLVGLGTWLRTTLHGGLGTLRTATGRLDLLLVGWALLPLLLVMVLHSVIYDGWRHLYFTYPALLLLAVRGIFGLWQLGRARPGWRRGLQLAGAAAGLAVAYVAGWMVQAHPYQNLYFSVLPGAVAERLFERDYWGLSGVEGLRWVLAHDTAAHIRIGTDRKTAPVLLSSQQLLPAADRARLVVVPAAQARYFVSIYRWHPASYGPEYGREVYVRRVGGIKILSVFHRP